MAKLRARIMMCLMILASALLPASAVTCDAEDGSLQINLDEIGIHLGRCHQGSCGNVVNINFPFNDLDD
jgi:hypothetical protein